MAVKIGVRSTEDPGKKRIQIHIGDRFIGEK
jgi:hypothetical protein